MKTDQVRRWGAKYLDINATGRVSVSPLRDAGATVDLFDVVQQARGRGLKFPLLIRFQDILRDRVVELNESFARAIAAAEYQGRYVGVFPIIPIHRLNEAPTRESALVDITCDSEGKIDSFIGGKTPRQTIPLHELGPMSLTILACFWSAPTKTSWAICITSSGG